MKNNYIQLLFRIAMCDGYEKKDNCTLIKNKKRNLYFFKKNIFLCTLIFASVCFVNSIYSSDTYKTEFNAFNRELSINPIEAQKTLEKIKAKWSDDSGAFETETLEEIAQALGAKSGQNAIDFMKQFFLDQQKRVDAARNKPLALNPLLPTPARPVLAPQPPLMPAAPAPTLTPPAPAQRPIVAVIPAVPIVVAPPAAPTPAAGALVTNISPELEKNVTTAIQNDEFDKALSLLQEPYNQTINGLKSVKEKKDFDALQERMDKISHALQIIGGVAQDPQKAQATKMYEDLLLAQLDVLNRNGIAPALKSLSDVKSDAGFSDLQAFVKGIQDELTKFQSSEMPPNVRTKAADMLAALNRAFIDAQTLIAGINASTSGADVKRAAAEQRSVSPMRATSATGLGRKDVEHELMEISNAITAKNWNEVNRLIPNAQNLLNQVREAERVSGVLGRWQPDSFNSLRSQLTPLWQSEVSQETKDLFEKLMPGFLPSTASTSALASANVRGVAQAISMSSISLEDYKTRVNDALEELDQKIKSFRKSEWPIDGQNIRVAILQLTNLFTQAKDSLLPDKFEDLLSTFNNRIRLITINVYNHLNRQAKDAVKAPLGRLSKALKTEIEQKRVAATSASTSATASRMSASAAEASAAQSLDTLTPAQQQAVRESSIVLTGETVYDYYEGVISTYYNKGAQTILGGQFNEAVKKYYNNALDVLKLAFGDPRLSEDEKKSLKGAMLKEVGEMNGNLYQQSYGLTESMDPAEKKAAKDFIKELKNQVSAVSVENATPFPAISVSKAASEFEKAKEKIVPLLVEAKKHIDQNNYEKTKEYLNQALLAFKTVIPFLNLNEIDSIKKLDEFKSLDNAIMTKRVDYYLVEPLINILKEFKNLTLSVTQASPSVSTSSTAGSATSMSTSSTSATSCPVPITPARTPTPPRRRLSILKPNVNLSSPAPIRGYEEATKVVVERAEKLLQEESVSDKDRIRRLNEQFAEGLILLQNMPSNVGNAEERVELANILKTALEHHARNDDTETKRLLADVTKMHGDFLQTIIEENKKNEEEKKRREEETKKAEEKKREEQKRAEEERKKAQERKALEDQQAALQSARRSSDPQTKSLVALADRLTNKVEEIQQKAITDYREMEQKSKDAMRNVLDQKNSLQSKLDEVKGTLMSMKDLKGAVLEEAVKNLLANMQK